MPPVRVQIACQNAAIRIVALALLRLKDQRASPVPEQHAGGTVIPVHQLAERLGPDHQHAARLTRQDHPVRIGQRKDKARANRLHVKGKAPRHAQIGLHHGRGGGKGEIGGGCGQDDRVQIIRLHPGIFQRGLRGAGGQIRCGLPFGREMPPLDPRTGADPLIRCVYRGLEFGIGHDSFGQIMPDALDDGTNGH